ncbi:putative glycoside hydrolase family 76 protein [Phaeoacremonium minimum UCRPA7]|uniref:Mannan endo-1,6-alpha-mannosidase n=1 Tax=Phaeoacremonium minimum (strain UCR-PA7) TaxID=1286976 RepID=R8BEE7_PHAM7|nr:putative glycoside hydrolase family 76 protein [Phaeoacremonium minimum UCRPA7]EON97684.1 putative glycoside hydrolase family 76 protein [Phaeoacremonium minimum UCRPA7]
MKASLVLSALAGAVSAATPGPLDVDLDSPASIKAACKTIAAALMEYYHGDEYGRTPGILDGPPPAGDYYWWEGGALWGTMVDYWHYTGDTTYNDVAESSLIFQAGAPQNSYMPPNWTASLGNDDQGFWGMSAMLAAEVKFQNPPSDQPQWLALAQAVFNTQAAPDRHDDTCGGGLRWQIPWSNNGYDYKNSIANGIFFNMGARLARYTDNDTYAKIAEDTWNWEVGVGLMSDKYDVYDGAHVPLNCTDVFKAQFSYNAAVWLQGAAFMYDYTNGSAKWEAHVAGLVNRTISVFFSKGAAVEVSCELEDKIGCKTDMLSFKGYLHRWMVTAGQLAPFLKTQIMTTLKASARGAADSCLSNGTCGFRWTTGSYDGVVGAGQQMNALAALSSLLVDESGVTGPLTNTTGGTSVGDPNAGQDPPSLQPAGPATTGAKAGAGILTAFVLSLMMVIMFWMSMNWNERPGKGERILSEKGKGVEYR